MILVVSGCNSLTCIGWPSGPPGRGEKDGREADGEFPDRRLIFPSPD